MRVVGRALEHSRPRADAAGDPIFSRIRACRWRAVRRLARLDADSDSEVRSHLPVGRDQTIFAYLLSRCTNSVHRVAQSPRLETQWPGADSALQQRIGAP